uniref:Protein kinase domain-containing protein n=1 Tax=Lactuca sativa TaxID=4236 RepID=A0A9R1UF51_LACSA|nr:hypothetical protein LSAT_V11C900473290 [Lactuca sativa]
MTNFCNDLQRQWQETIDPQNLVVGKVIGHGSEGVVYKGSYKGHTVAVKVLDDNGKKKISEDSNVTKMIGATMSMITSGSRHKIKNPKPENNFCVVSEYLKGGSLRSYLLKLKHQDKKLPYKTVIRFAIDIAKGLSYLHSQKVIHRDVKPGNMLIDKKQTIKLADFGESEIEPPELLITCGERGTHGYMAPELVSKHPHGRKCDVYSFGICLWEIYCCDTAYTYDLGILTPDIYKYTRPSIPRHCPRSLAKLMEQCWDTDPTKRPEMEEVVVISEEIEKSQELQSEMETSRGLVQVIQA